MRFLEMRKPAFIIKAMIVVVIIVLALILAARLSKEEGGNQLPEPSVELASSTSPAFDLDKTNDVDSSWPIVGALTRVTKKPFGLYVSPENSPVSPEKFAGYHTGVDFETYSQEQNIDVPIYAICSGSLALKKAATGYGGVAIQTCEIDQEPVTVVYGHLRLESITIDLGEQISQGQQIGFLGQGDSAETSGERKHLHLGIHKGETINLLGYVADKSELNQWIDWRNLDEQLISN